MSSSCREQVTSGLAVGSNSLGRAGGAHTSELTAVIKGGLRGSQASAVTGSDHLFPLGHCEKSSLHLFKPSESDDSRLGRLT